MTIYRIGQSFTVLAELNTGYILMKVVSLVNEISIHKARLVDIGFADEHQDIELHPLLCRDSIPLITA